MTALLKFKTSIANQLSKHTPCRPQDITTFMRPAKHRKDGHISISLPKLNASLVNPTPKQEWTAWTETIAEKVSIEFPLLPQLTILNNLYNIV